MQEWVDTLRSKLREMKILSPKENLYSKLPELRPPLLPTRDPMSPLPETPAIPAAIPGVEQVVSTNQTSRINNSMVANAVLPSAPPSNVASNTTQTNVNTAPTTIGQNAERSGANRASNGALDTMTATVPVAESIDDFGIEPSTSSSTQPSTSNTLSHNLIKMLYPVTKYSQHASDIDIDSVITAANESNDDSHSIAVDSFTNDPNNSNTVNSGGGGDNDSDVSSLARTFANNVLSDPSASSTPKRNQVAISSTSTEADDRVGSVGDCSVFPIYPSPEPLVIPRPQTSRSASSKKARSKSESSIEPNVVNDAPTTNITIIQVSSTIAEEVAANESVNEHSDTTFTNTVQIIPSSSYAPIEENAITTVQVISDASTNHTAIVDSIPIDERSMLSTTIEPQSDGESSQQFTGVTNISIGIKDRTVVQQIKTTQPEQMHYEQVFVTQIPTTSTIKAPGGGGDDQQTESSGHSKELHVNRIKLNKTDTPTVSVASEHIEPSTSHISSASGTITFSIAATNGGGGNSSGSAEATNNLNAVQIATVVQPKEVKIKNANDGNAASRRPLLTRGLTEAVIIRPSRKDVVRPNLLGNQVSLFDFLVVEQ